MFKDNSSIPSILQNLRDEILKDTNVMIVLCGNAISFIEKNLPAEKNPLYGRAAGFYKMTEIDIMATSRQNTEYFIGKCAFISRPFRYFK